MTNVEQYIKRLPTIMTEVKTTLEGGIPVAGGDLTDIKTNTSDTASNTADCAGGLSSLVACTNTLGASTYNKGLASSLFVSAVRNEAQMTLSDTDGYVCPIAVDSKGNVQTDQVKILGTAIDTNSGNKSNGSQRICIASDDVLLSRIAGSYDGNSNLVQCNLRAINDSGVSKNSGIKDDGCQRIVIATDDVNISVMSSDISTIANILNDVWDSTAHALRTV